MEKMRLNIQQFAEGEMIETTDSTTESSSSVEVVQQPTFTELLRNPEYQREFDRLVSKSLNTAKTKWENDYQAKLEAERTEAEKLAKMDATQKMDYELSKTRDENASLHSKLNAMNLQQTAVRIASEKGLPAGYLDLIDFSQETADSIGSKIDTLQELRRRDMTALLNSRLRQPVPQERIKQEKRIDPYVEGFLSEF